MLHAAVWHASIGVQEIGVVYEQVPVAALHVPGEAKHAGGEVHEIGVPGVHIPFMHAMVPVHEFPPPPQLVPSAAAGFEQVPLLGLHTPATWQSSLAVHTTGLDPVHAPLLQE